ncbi:glycosyltransferase [Rhodopirellula sp. MGV]|uniref:glycosyltransferase n=1 Tax=Rhodopirellula sp. MGV TaxID=2023130 RepID=UPI000B97523C|nr:glycosyltransferase [Rhodopirellula sp. MGV]OYP34103.1 hypothetical protein CGZ80_16390 [Rhodopirellula sp. MGV]PNY35616.1 hypothetical protein C2E31_17275 [Rhodopirellula baltica]
MRLVFLCGCLDPGKDGVGDYVRRLAGELVRQGHQVAAIAVNERELGCPIKREIQVDEFSDLSSSVSVLRLSSQVNWRERSEEIVEFLKTERPDVISVQFVPYSFHRKGIPFSFVGNLIGIARQFDARWNVMFHELWLAGDSAPTKKKKIVGWLQRRLVSRLLSRLDSMCKLVVTTNSELHKEQLLKIGVETVNRLPLFSNIAFVEHSDDSRVPGVATDEFVVLHFGSFGSNVEAYLLGLERTTKLAAEKRLKLFVVGGGGPHREKCLNAMKAALIDGQVVDFGRVDASLVSSLMASSDVMISRAKKSTWQKSGSVMAALEHGVDVICSDGTVIGRDNAVSCQRVADEFVELMGAECGTVSNVR